MNDAVERLVNALPLVLPEVLLVAAACVHFLAGPFLVSDRGEAPPGLRHRWAGLALAALAAAAWLWLIRPAESAMALGPFRNDELTWFVRGLSLAGGAVLLLTNWNRADDAHAAEAHACLLLIVAGVNLVAAANDLTGLFLALELVSVPTYVALYLGRRDATGQEAVLKYFLLSVFSSALVLLGFSHLYGLTGTTNLTAIRAALAAGGAGPMPPTLLVAAAAVIAGLGFRVTAVPFHFYAPDVFQGTSTAGAALLSFVPKAAGFVALIRLLVTPLADETLAGGPLWTLLGRAAPALWALAVLSMCVGNALALVQTNVRRLMAYSSIAHAGYMLVGLAVAPRATTVGGVPSLLFYLAAYAAMTLGVFAVLSAVRTGPARSDAAAADGLRHRIDATDDLAGMGRSHPVAALLMTVFLFSLTGLPPTAGFLGKFNLFAAAWSADTSDGRWLAALMALNAAVAAWYYLRLIGVMYLHAPADRPARPVEAPALVGGVLCAAATVALFVAPDWLWQTVAGIRG